MYIYPNVKHTCKPSMGDPVYFPSQPNTSLPRLGLETYESAISCAWQLIRHFRVAVRVSRIKYGDIGPRYVITTVAEAIRRDPVIYIRTSLCCDTDEKKPLT